MSHKKDYKIALIGVLLVGWFIAASLVCITVHQNTSILKGSYEIHWSGTTAEQYKVDDSTKGDFESKKYFEFGTTICFEHETDDPDSLKIKIWVNIEDPDKPYIYKYEIKADYSSAEDKSAHISIPGKINGSGHGDYDWQDSWKIKIHYIKVPETLWGIKENFIILNFLYFHIAGALIIIFYGKRF